VLVESSVDSTARFKPDAL
jgi:hypothetical protein